MLAVADSSLEAVEEGNAQAAPDGTADMDSDAEAGRVVVQLASERNKGVGLDIACAEDKADEAVGIAAVAMEVAVDIADSQDKLAGVRALVNLCWGLRLTKTFSDSRIPWEVAYVEACQAEEEEAVLDVPA